MSFKRRACCRVGSDLPLWPGPDENWWMGFNRRTKWSWLFNVKLDLLSRQKQKHFLHLSDDQTKINERLWRSWEVKGQLEACSMSSITETRFCGSDRTEPSVRGLFFCQDVSHRYSPTLVCLRLFNLYFFKGIGAPVWTNSGFSLIHKHPPEPGNTFRFQFWFWKFWTS